MSAWREVVASRFGGVHTSRRDRRMPLPDAIRRFVRPGMRLNPVSLQSRPVAAMSELIRQFAGTRPGFEFVSSSLSGNYLQLVGAGLLRKAVVSFAGEGYPTPGPSPVVARALEEGGFELEGWTMLTISQRLLAAAQGVPFATTRSIAGSDLAPELERAGGYAEVDDPFARGVPGARVGVVRAYTPDVAFVHAWAADAAGNAVCFPPYQENVYGALAAREGVIVTAHRIVDADFVRRHAHLVRVPAEKVLAVCEARYGSHPYGNYAAGVPELVPYANDYAFMAEHRAAQESAARYEAWLREWVLGVDGHEAFLAKLGRDRLQGLERSAEPASWRAELEAHAPSLDAAGPATPIEEMIVQASRIVAARIAGGGFETLLSGVGQAALTAWLAAHALRDGGREVALVAETGMYGHDPRPADPFLVGCRNMTTTTLLTDVLEALGLHACGGANRCLATLGAGQIDAQGRINSTRGPDGRYLVGSGGANDIANAAQEIVAVAVQRPQTFVSRVDYVTSPGERVQHLVSTHGHFEKQGGVFVLTGVFQSAGPSPEDVVEQVRARCGFPLQVSPTLAWLPPAGELELATLRLFDPERFFLGRRRTP